MKWIKYWVREDCFNFEGFFLFCILCLELCLSISRKLIPTSLNSLLQDDLPCKTCLKTWPLPNQPCSVTSLHPVFFFFIVLVLTCIYNIYLFVYFSVVLLVDYKLMRARIFSFMIVHPEPRTGSWLFGEGINKCIKLWNIILSNGLNDKVTTYLFTKKNDYNEKCTYVDINSFLQTQHIYLYISKCEKNNWTILICFLSLSLFYCLFIFYNGTCNVWDQKEKRISRVAVEWLFRIYLPLYSSLLHKETNDVLFYIYEGCVMKLCVSTHWEVILFYLVIWRIC